MSPDDASAQYASQPPGAWHSDPTYGGMITNLDGNIGRVVDYLETTEDPRNPGGMLIDNTLLIVMSDNGAAGGYVAEGADTRDVSNQLPLRSGKGTLWEGGMRVPLVVRWDRAGSGGRIVDTPVQHIDVFPTITDLAGATVDPSVVIDGESLRPLFAANQGTLSRSQIFFHFPAYLEYPQTNPVEVRETPGSVVWDDRWKLIWRYETATWELYDVDADIAEQNQVAASHPDVVAELGQHLVDWLVETDASLPQYKGTTDEVPLPDPSAI